MSPFWILLELRMTWVAVTTGAIKREKFQAIRHHQQTRIQLFTGNQRCQSIEENVSYSTDFIPGSKLTPFHHSLLAPTWTAFSDYTGPDV